MRREGHGAGDYLGRDDFAKCHGARGIWKTSLFAIWRLGCGEFHWGDSDWRNRQDQVYDARRDAEFGVYRLHARHQGYSAKLRKVLSHERLAALYRITVIR